MSEKRYYWLKLKEDYFNSPKIKKLRKIAGGDTYTIIYLKMQLLSIKNQGVIQFEGIEPTIEEELALKLDEDIENIRLTLAFLEAQNLCELNNNNEFLLVEATTSIGSEVDSAERVRKFREKQNTKILQEPKTNALRQRQFRAKEFCKQFQHIPFIEDYTNNKRYNGNYYLVLKRDEMKCSICNNIENLCVHHIDGFDELKPENSNQNKMITLCRGCHSKVHSNSIDIPNTKLESIGYYDDSNESNEMCNSDVTKCNDCSISISNSISNSISSSIFNSISNNKEDIKDDNAYTKNGKSITPTDVELDLFNYWDTLKVPKGKLNYDRVQALRNTLKEFDAETIKGTMKRYETVNNDNDYFFKYDWHIEEFLKQKNAFSTFLEDGSKWLNYITQNSNADKKPENVITVSTSTPDDERREKAKSMDRNTQIANFHGFYDNNGRFVDLTAKEE